MSSVNLVVLVGRLGQDPEVRYSADQKPIANLSLATSKAYKDKAGEKQETTTWHRVVAFGKTAETLGEHARKGALLYVDGELSTRSWTDKQEQKRYTTEVVVNRFQFLGGGKREPDAGDAPAGSVREKAREPDATAATGRLPGGFDEMDDDIPF